MKKNRAYSQQTGLADPVLESQFTWKSDKPPTVKIK